MDYKKLRVPVAGALIDDDDLSLALDALRNKEICYGEYNKLFEQAFADYIGAKYAIACNSGSSANLLALSALDLKPGDEVITTALNFPTTVNPIVQCGATPVFVDCKINGNADIDKISEAVTIKTKAIIIAHALGRPQGIINNRSYGIAIIEDCCDALGSEINYKKVGRADISTFSFYPAHQITTGEGGMVLTSNEQLAKKLRSLRDWGRSCYCEPGHDNTCGHRFDGNYDHKYTYSHIGYNLKMANIQAAIGLRQLKHIEEFVDFRERNYKYYDDLFHEWHDEDPEHYPFYNLEVREERTSYFGYPLIIRNRMERKGLLEYMEANGVGVRLWFAGNITNQPAYKDVKYRVVGDLKMTDYLMANAFWIGCWPGLTLEQLDYAVKVIREYCEREKK
jgi:CDP-4-dehydro-6-deoxyglucose reductase, E1